MKKYFIIFLALLFLCNCYETKEEKTNPRDGLDPIIRHKSGIAPVIVIFGDSRADQGGTWDEIENEIYNVGVGGQSTVGIINKQLPLLKDLHGVYYFLFTGINDANFVEPDVFRANLEHIITFVRHECEAEIIICDISLNPDFVGQHHWDDTSINRSIMESTSASYLYFNIPSEDFVDWCHFNQNGYIFVSQILQNYKD